MKDCCKKYNLKPIDPDKLHMEKIPDKELYYIDLPLESTPSVVWSQLFAIEYKGDFNRKWPAELTGSIVRVITSEEHTKSQVEWAINLIKATNDAVDRYNSKVKQENDIEEQRLKKDKETMDKMREALKK